MIQAEAQNLFTEAFETHRDSLRSYILRITASVEDTNDIVQETWIKGSQNYDKYQGKSSLKTWMFSIASNLAKDYLKRSKRWTENTTDICKEAAMNNPTFFKEAMDIRTNSPQGNFEIREHIAFCFTCIAKSLSVEQHLTLMLKEIHEFRIHEIATILQLNEPIVKYHLHMARGKMNDIFDRRCALINKEGVCDQCTELNGIFNPKQKAEEEKQKIKMVREAESGKKEHLFDLRMEILREIDPFKSGAAELQLHHLEHNRQVMEDYLKKNS